MIGRTPWPRHDSSKPRALAISLGLHVASFCALMYAPPLSLSVPQPSPTEYQQAFAGKEDKIVWYKFRDLPEIAQRKSDPSRQPLRAEVKAKQAIVSSPKNTPKRDRVILTPSPLTDIPPLDLPNLIAVKLPPKQFTTPPDLVKPAEAKIAKIDAPVAPDAPSDLQLQTAKLAKPFLPPPAQAPKQMARIEAPSLATENAAKEYVPTPALSPKLPADRLPSRAYVPPPREAPTPQKIGAAVEVATGATNLPSGAAMPSVKLPARAFVPPPATPGTQSSKSIAAPQIDGPPGDITIAIAGLNPATTQVKLPAASSPAQFSAGEKIRPDGATSDGSRTGISVPDLYAHAPGGDKKPDLLAMASVNPSSKEFMNEALRHSSPIASGEATIPSAATPQHPTGTRVSSAPDARFNGRDVYMMAIQMSNLTSFSGSWLMWYSPRTAREAELDPIAAPVPHRKVDPKYTPSAISDRVEGKVQLFCVIGREGTVTSIELLRGADERLNRSAEEALSKWEFYPATRDGQPVDVDVVVEIPFTLAPPTPSR